MNPKRMFDILVALLLIVVLSPLMAMIALSVLAAEGTPILFRQERIGFNGRAFNIAKFRTMFAGEGSKITAGGDPRITRLGAFLRQWKLDELPQLFNVLRGDMSLVGPRPEVPHYVALYTAEQRGVFSVRPGLTDWATIRFRDEESILAGYDDKDRAYRDIILPEKLRLNLLYVAERSFFGDLKIIASTIRAIFAPRETP